MLLEPCPRGDSIERVFKCKSCNEPNKRYWDSKHLVVASQKPHGERLLRHSSSEELDTAF